MARVQIYGQKSIDARSEEIDFQTSGTSTFRHNGVPILTQGSNLVLQTVGTAPNNNAASLAGVNFRLQPADATHPGVLTSGEQHIGGAKYLDGGVFITGDGVLNGSNIITEATLPPSGTLEMGEVLENGNSQAARIQDGFLQMAPATGESPGVVTSGNQEFGGTKTFTGPTFLNGDATFASNINLDWDDSTPSQASIKMGGIGVWKAIGTSLYVGKDAGSNYPTENYNTVFGTHAGYSVDNTSNGRNTMMGYRAGYNLKQGEANTLIGAHTGQDLSGTNCEFNICVGCDAGSGLNQGTEGYCICIGNLGIPGDYGVIRIGDDQVAPGPDTDSTYVQFIYGTPVSDGLAVEVDKYGKLGSVVSTRKQKEDIQDLTDEEAENLYGLEPKHFRMKRRRVENDIRYGIIAEDAEKLFPNHIVHDSKGEISGFRYNDLHPFYIANFKRTRRELESLKQQCEKDKAEVMEMMLELQSKIK